MAVFHCLEDNPLALCSRNGRPLALPAPLPSQCGVVGRNDVVAFSGMLFETLDAYRVGHDLVLGVQNGAALPPLPVSETHVLPNAPLFSSSVHSHRALPPNSEI